MSSPLKMTAQETAALIKRGLSELEDFRERSRAPSRPKAFPLHATPEESVLIDGAPWLLAQKPTPTQRSNLKSLGLAPFWDPAAHHTPHLVCGTVRAVLELEACKSICQTTWPPASGTGYIIDVGANGLRLQQSLELAFEGTEETPPTWSLLPVLQAGDAGRLQMAKNHRVLFQHCECLAEECPHIHSLGRKGQIRAFVMVHSMYYFTREFILELTGYAPVFAVAHTYYDAAGVHGSGEMPWCIHSDGNVHARAAGNAHEYVHPDNAWLQGSHFSANNKTMSWVVEHSLGDQAVFRFDRTSYRAPVVPRQLTWTDVDADGILNEQLTALFQKGVKTVWQDRTLGPLHSLGFEIAEVSRIRVYLQYGRPSFQLGDKVRITIPRDAIGFAASQATLQSRTPMLMQSIHRALVINLGKGGVAPDMISQVALVATIAGLTRDIERETGTIGMYNRNFTSINEEHTRVLQGSSLHKWTWRDYFFPSNWVGLVQYHCLCKEEAFTVPEAVQYQQLRNQGLAPSFHGPLLALGGSNQFGPIAELKPSPADLAEGARITLLPDDGQRPPAPPVLTQHLPAFMGQIPTTTHNTEEAFIAGAKARVLAERPPSELGVWSELARTARTDPSLAHLFLDEPIVLTDALVEAWASRYPVKQAKLFLAAWREANSRALKPRDFEGSPFLKIEKSGNATASGPPAIDPRLVVAMRPIVTAIMGPVFHAVGNACRAHQRRFFAADIQPLTEIIWVNGMHSEDFGRMIDYALQTIDDPWFVWGDMSRFESHRTPECARAMDSIDLEYCEHELYQQVLLETDGVHGRAQRFPVRIDVDNRLSSGLGKTSHDSMKRNSLAQRHVFGQPIPGLRAMFDNGDDWTHVIAESQLIKEADFHSRLLELGLVSDFHVGRLHEVEFCQLLMWPDSTGATVPASKPFRVMSRLPFSTSSDKYDPAGVARSLLVANNHVPFLGPYLRFVVGRSSARKAPIPEWHLDAKHKHHAGPPTYGFLLARYGLSYQDELDFIALLATATSLHTVINYPDFARCLAIDDA